MKLVTHNIRFGRGNDGRNDLHHIKGADIIALQEAEQNWEHSNNVDQPEIPARYLPTSYWVCGPYFDVGAGQKTWGNNDAQGSDNQLYWIMIDDYNLAKPPET